MQALFVILSAAALLLVQSVSAQVNNPNYPADNCTAPIETYYTCVDDALVDATLVGYATVQDYCYANAPPSNQANYQACLCERFTRLVTCLINSCPNDKTDLAALRQAQGPNCQAATILSTSSTSKAATGSTGTSTTTTTTGTGSFSAGGGPTLALPGQSSSATVSASSSSSKSNGAVQQQQKSTFAALAGVAVAAAVVAVVGF